MFSFIKNQPYNYTLLACVMMVLLLHANTNSIYSQENRLPWLDQLTSSEQLDSLTTISTKAQVTVSDGLRYLASTLYHDKQRAIFHRVYDDKTVTLGIEGKYLWSFDGEKEAEGSSFLKGFIHGHQFHAQILFFNQIHDSITNPSAAFYTDQKCLAIETRNESPQHNFYFLENGLPIGFEIIREDEPNIQFQFDNWQLANDIMLPHTVYIDDGERKFKYSYQNISFNNGSMEDYRAPYITLTDEQKLMRKHRIIMDGHFFGLTTELKDQQSDTFYILSEGEIYDLPGNQPNAVIDRIMSNRDYTTYDDLIRPRISISNDGTIGWVIAQVYAKGIRFDENGNSMGPLEFTSAWIELYEKRDGKWKMKGNVSNFKPGLQ